MLNNFRGRIPHVPREKKSPMKLANKEFKRRFYVLDNGDVVFHKSLYDKTYDRVDYITNVEELDGGYVRILNIPPALQVIPRSAPTYQELLVLTQEYEAILIEKDYPQGRTLDLPLIKRFMNPSTRGLFAIDVENNLIHVQDRGRGGYIPSESLIDDVKLFGFSKDYFIEFPTITATEDNQIIICDSETLIDPRSDVQRIQMDYNIQAITDRYILLSNGDIYVVTYEDRSYNIILLIQLDYPARDIIYNGNLLVIDENGKLINYSLNGNGLEIEGIKEYGGRYNRFIIYNHMIFYIESDDGQLYSIESSKLIAIRFPYRLMDIKEQENIINAQRMIKSSRSSLRRSNSR